MIRDLPAGFIERWEKEIGPVKSKERKGFRECYTTLKGRGLPADEWFFDAFNFVARKKRNGTLRGDSEGGNTIGYFISVIRNWENNGRGSVGSWQDRVIISLVERKFKRRLDFNQKSKLYELMGKHGSFAVYVAVSEYNYLLKNINDILEKEVPNNIKNLKRESYY